MSNKNKGNSSKRPYTLRARARRREAVHRRITLAAVYLHGSVGPARTTVSEIAKRAGVRRATVYNHFPTDLELINACSSHWFGQNPPPDPSAWAEVADPRDRVRVALGAMYEYYDRGKEMLENVLRDSPQVTALEEILRLKWWPLLEQMVQILAEGWASAVSGATPPREVKETALEPRSIQEQQDPALRGSLRVALDFFTWQTLTDSGLSDREAATLVAGWVSAVSTVPQPHSTGWPT